jgi:GLPGLI family protein
MKHRTMRIAMGLSLALIIAVCAFGQGVYWESKVTGGPIKDQTDQMYYMPKMFKRTSTGDANIMIVRLDKETMYILKPKEKTYSEITFAEMEAMMKKGKAKMDSRMAEMQKKMQSMPEEQRKMMEKMMGDKMPGTAKDAKVDVSSTGEKKAIGGFSCTKYVVTQDGKEFMTLWTTKDVKEFEPMRKDFEAFSQRMSSMNPMAGKGMMDAFRKVDGFPIETDMSGITNVVTKIEKRSTPAGEFEVPSGYTKVKSEMQEGMEKMEHEKED